MGEHYTRSTVSASAWCARCQKQTMHRIDGVRKGPCMECMLRLDRDHSKREADAKNVMRQANLWGDTT